MAQRIFLLIFNVISVTVGSSCEWHTCCSRERHASQGGARVRNSTEAQSLAPRDVSLNWISDFEPQLSWKLPPHLPESCCFCVQLNSKYTYTHSLCGNQTNYTPKYQYTKGSSLSMSVQTICDNMTSEQVRISIYPELVTDLDCYKLTRNLIRCTWRPVPGAPQSTFFYKARFDNETISNLQPCPKLYNDSDKTVCDLQISPSYKLMVLFNGTVDKKTVRNTFEIQLFVQPSLKYWNVTRVDGRYNISWVTPDDADSTSWEFIVLYKECAESGRFKLIDTYSHMIDLQPGCSYCFSVEANYGNRKYTTQEKCFDADADIFLPAVIIVPLTCFALAVLALVCCIRNKDSICPPIPTPRDLLSDISDNDKTQFENIHCPSETEELLKITLVTDPPIKKLEL